MSGKSNLAPAIEAIVPTDAESARALIKIVDDFCPNFEELRREADLAESNLIRHEGIHYPDMVTGNLGRTAVPTPCWPGRAEERLLPALQKGKSAANLYSLRYWDRRS